MSKILVTGGSGFIGSNLVARLKTLNHDVISTGTHPANRIAGVQYVSRGFEGFDWTVLSGVEVCFHLGANNDTLCFDERQMLRDNLYAPIKLFHSLLKAGCKKFIYASSCATYGDAPTPYKEDETICSPLNIYGESKLRFDKFAIPFGEEHELSVIGFRYPNVYGPGESQKNRRASMVTQLIKQMWKGNMPKLFEDGTQKRDYIYVKDAVEANVKAMDYEGSGIFNCANGKPTSFNEIVEILNNLFKKKLNIQYLKNPHLDKYQNHTECDNSKLVNLINYAPKYDMKQGIADYMRYYLSEE